MYTVHSRYGCRPASFARDAGINVTLYFWNNDPPVKPKQTNQYDPKPNGLG